MTGTKQKCVLMATEIMGYGGAETHVYELTRALLKQNWRVVLISSGGVLADRLEQFGAVKYNIPMRSKSLPALLSAYKKIASVIKKEKVDILHAHSRIPALLLHYASKQFSLPFVTTDHARFRNHNYLTKLMTKWGQRTLAVSEDLKTYLLENYKNVRPENIALTVNGIDTETFHDRGGDEVLREHICHEFGIAPHEKIILSVSRLDQSAYLCVYELLEIARDLHSSLPESRLMIVGGGDIYHDVERRATEINREIGHEYILLTGARSDIDKLCGICTCFVGCARSAIEAVSCEKPVIIAGDGGYVGILNEDNFEFCVSSNFTARGITSFPLDIFLRDIQYALNHTEQLLPFCKKARELIRETYSTQRMANDALETYHRAIRAGGRLFDCAIAGYYGHGNMGDDSLLFTVIRNLRESLPDLRICILCHYPSALAKTLKDLGFTVKNRFNPISVFFCMKKSSVLLFGGGTLIQDNTSTKSLLYYLFLIQIAARLGLKIMLYGNGIGPIIREKNKKRVKQALELCDILTLRDDESMKTAREMGITGPEIHRTADEALTYSPPGEMEITEAMGRYGLAGKGYVVISVRKWKRATGEFYDKLGSALAGFCGATNLTPVFTVMESAHDDMVTRTMAQTIPGSILVRYHADPSEIAAIIGGARFVISMRLHTLIFAAIKGVDMIGIAYDPKVENFLCSLGYREHSIDVADFCPDRFLKIALSHYEKRGKRQEEKTLIDREILRAKDNAAIAQRLFESL